MDDVRPPDLWDPDTFERARKMATSDAFCTCGIAVPTPRAQQLYDCGLPIHCGACCRFVAIPDF